jgi:cation transport protein ChaC
MAEAIARAVGPLGKCEDYLFNTVAHLDELGLTDHRMSKLAGMVRALKA